MNDNKPKNTASLMQISKRLKTVLKQLEGIIIFDNEDKKPNTDNTTEKIDKN